MTNPELIALAAIKAFAMELKLHAAKLETEYTHENGDSYLRGVWNGQGVAAQRIINILEGK